MSPLRVLVVDDELPARERLCELLRQQNESESVAQACGADDAAAALTLGATDLVFLDVQMPRKNGFDLAREIGREHMPATVFVTAYDQYALKAFDLDAVDYLLKPFEDERFERAPRRAREVIEPRRSVDVAGRLRAALQAVDPAQPQRTRDYLQRIAVESRGRIRLILAEQIDYVSASGVYAELHVGDQTHVIRERMQVLEQRLDPARFLRIHRSVIVQLDRIDVLLRQPGGDYALILKNGAQLSVSRNRVEQLASWTGVTENLHSA